MLLGTIEGVTGAGSVILLAVKDLKGASHSVWGDPRLMSMLLDGVLAEAEREGVHPTTVQVLAEAPGAAEWVALVSSLPTETLEAIHEAGGSSSPTGCRTPWPQARPSPLRSDRPRRAWRP